MRPVTPPGPGGRLQRSVAASLAAILELDPSAVPVPDERHPEPWTVWNQWLALRGLGLVPIAEPRTFNWPGPWLAVLAGDVGVVAFGSPPGIAWRPFDGPETFAAVRAGYAVAPADVALWSPAPAAPRSRAGRVEAIVIAPDAEAPMTRVDRALARADRGLEGDRYSAERGTFSNAHGRGYDLTLIEAEVLDALGRFAAEDIRRNVVTRGIDLNALVGRPFAIGDVRCLGQRLCEPCAHLERLTPGTLRPLIHRGGLRADVLSDGEIRVGDEIIAG
jgi:hypothetical protein